MQVPLPIGLGRGGIVPGHLDVVDSAGAVRDSDDDADTAAEQAKEQALEPQKEKAQLPVKNAFAFIAAKLSALNAPGNPK